MFTITGTAHRTLVLGGLQQVLHYFKEAYLVVVMQWSVEDVSMYYVMYGRRIRTDGIINIYVVISMKHHAKHNLASARLNHHQNGSLTNATTSANKDQG